MRFVVISDSAEAVGSLRRGSGFMPFDLPGDFWDVFFLNAHKRHPFFSGLYSTAADFFFKLRIVFFGGDSGFQHALETRDN